jgi:glycosyltransferase involved in cell wall biosynthesis
LKIYKAMAMEKPIVSTSVGAEGLPISDDVELLIADSAGAFAESIVRVLRDEAFAISLTRKAAATVRENFGWARAAKDLARSCQQAINTKPNVHSVSRQTKEQGGALEPHGRQV